MVTALTESMSHHTIIVAQSGSGKSFFVGRLIEEILLNSRSRVLVFDPNSDFRKSSLTVERSRWTNARYNPVTKEGYLPHESIQREFKQRWKSVTKRIYSTDGKKSKAVEQLKIDWLNFSVDWFADDADLAFQSELRHCHNFVNELRPAVRKKSLTWRDANELLGVCKRICGQTTNMESDEVLAILRKEFGRSKRLERHLSEASKFRPLIGRGAELFYFGIGREALGSEIFAVRYPIDRPSPPARLHVIDLLSIENFLFRMMAVGNFLNVEWIHARKLWQRALDSKATRDTRVPLFIVLDEAHNIIPAQATNLAQRRLKEWFRTIAAEGRKFGIFLILISQRPDKIDPLVVSECENRAIMRIGSELVLDETTKLLGLSAAQKIEANKCLGLLRGRALLCGPWAGGQHRMIYSAMRRTEEGGRNLREKYWARI